MKLVTLRREKEAFSPNNQIGVEKRELYPPVTFTIVTASQMGPPLEAWAD